MEKANRASADMPFMLGFIAPPAPLMRYHFHTLLIVLSLAWPCGCTSKPSVNPAADSAAAEYPNVIPKLAEDALLKADELELFSLDAIESNSGAFHRWGVLGKTVISDPETKTKIVSAFKKSIPTHDDGAQVGCFEPHHGIRVSYLKMQIDFVICFSCGPVDVFANEQDIGSFRVTSEGRPKAVFDDELRRAGVSLGWREPK